MSVAALFVVAGSWKQPRCVHLRESGCILLNTRQQLQALTMYIQLHENVLNHSVL